MRWIAIALIAALPEAAHAASGKLPQMDFANPLTLAQVVWMAIIMGVLYVLLRNWLLPQVDSVLAERRTRIRTDLDAAQQASHNAQQAVTELDRAIAEARAESDRTVTAAIEAAKARARIDHDASAAALELELARAEQQIAQTRGDAMASLTPIAEDVAASLLERLTGHPADRTILEHALAHIQAARLQAA
jgi:F-type H+-transporting ATPase subunit b